ncbi:hypothetical protein QYE76_008670 [Lolium multiflorum]|uniref:CCHC-type domain-containing protein n=1 Tax=Lolium multiflorum TaxID=4521 RepID=A0AAD8TTK6_LOLMU|nr:hypothetical protein QYE76_008670 [Lolium multiflorum]
MIHMAVSPKDRAHIRTLKTAKEAWDKLDKLFLGNASIQSSCFDEVNNLADNFVMLEGESAEDVHWRLMALAVQLGDLGATFADDLWVKRKFCNALLPYEEVKLTAIRQNAHFRSMTSDEAKVHEKSESDEDPIEWSPDDLKTNYHEYMALAAKNFWDGNKTRGSRPRGNSRYTPHDSSRSFSKSPREGQKARTCYNCGDKSHFVADCPFEKREDNGGRLVRKDKSKSFSKGYSKSSSKPGDNKTSFNKKPRAFAIREEYSSDDGDDNDEKNSNMEEEGVAAIAINTPSNSLVNSTNENLVTNNSHFLMAKVSEVSPPPKPTSSSNASSIDDATSLAIKHELATLRRQKTTLLEVNSLQEEALDEYYRLSKEKVPCCNHEEEIAALEKTKAKLLEINGMQDESLMEYFHLSKEKVTCCDHEEKIAALERNKTKLLEINAMQEEALNEDFPLSKDRVTCCDHEDEIATLERHKRLLLRMNSLQEDALKEHFV